MLYLSLGLIIAALSGIHAQCSLIVQTTSVQLLLSGVRVPLTSGRIDMTEEQYLTVTLFNGNNIPFLADFFSGRDEQEDCGPKQYRLTQSSIRAFGEEIVVIGTKLGQLQLLPPDSTGRYFYSFVFDFIFRVGEGRTKHRGSLVLDKIPVSTTSCIVSSIDLFTGQYIYIGNTKYIASNLKMNEFPSGLIHFFGTIQKSNKNGITYLLDLWLVPVDAEDSDYPLYYYLRSGVLTTLSGDVVYRFTDGDIYSQIDEGIFKIDTTITDIHECLEHSVSDTASSTLSSSTEVECVGFHALFTSV